MNRPWDTPEAAAHQRAQLHRLIDCLEQPRLAHLYFALIASERRVYNTDAKWLVGREDFDE